MIEIVLYAVSALLVVVIALVAVGRETFKGVTVARPVVFDVTEAVDFISEGLPDGPASRLTPDDVKWILGIDVDQLEKATAHADHLELGREVLDQDTAIAAVLERADAADKELLDVDVAAVLAGRTRYLEAIGAIGPLAPDDGRDSLPTTEI